MFSTFKEGMRSAWMLITADLSDERRAGAWIAVVRSLILFILILLIFHVLWAQGAFTFFEWGKHTGFLPRSSAVQEIRDRVSDRVVPLKDDIGMLKGDQAEMKSELRQMQRQVTQILRLNLQQRLNQLKRQHCLSDPNTIQRALIASNIRNMQEEYEQVSGGLRYNLPDCDDLVHNGMYMSER